MADTHDTIDGLLAEFRGYAAGMPPSYHVTMSWHDFRQMLDRFEAAHRRERGDAAKLREALRECAQYIACVGGIGVGEVTINDNVHLIPEELTQKAIAALAAPARNCDKYATADEALKAQEQMFNDSNFANGECKLGCPECDNPRVGCKIAWLFAPATEKEGGNDADK